ncbi:hypothetical protein Q9299_05105 [Gemmobacter fulvus]|uniref:hypothetical protein n=1 Tax=Gemmobacter fulvus TaxID=2840474 RepID=UPI0027969FAB|nr:hypothetical protein [Gemmobacter fulvus]MDQ1847660.1 hypothetical protein [Gemmobacter fulvus]
MHITLTPMRHDLPLALLRAGDVLVINGSAYDFGPLPEGALLPRVAVDCAWLAGDITRSAGQLRLALILPHGAEAGFDQLHPAALLLSQDGPVSAPGLTAPNWPTTAPGNIDWAHLIPAEALAAAALATAKSAARAEITARISAARSAMITTLPGQQMIYLAKEAEARAFLTDPAPDLAAYPLLSAEIGITAPNALQLAQIWLNMGDLWRSTAAGLEALRLGSAAAVEAAGTVAEVEAAMGVFEGE